MQCVTCIVHLELYEQSITCQAKALHVFSWPSLKSLFSFLKSPVIRATFYIILHQVMLRCKLKSVVARITTHLKHCHSTKFLLLQVEKNCWKKIDASSTCWSNFATTKFCCVTMFEVGGNTANNAFQLATQQCCLASCSNLLLVLLHLYAREIHLLCNYIHHNY